MRTFGVEEELLIVDPATGVPLALADALLRGLKPAPDVEPSPTSGAPAPDVEQSAAAEPAHEESSFSFELKLEQIETQTAPCLDYGGLLHQIRQSRAFTDQAARVLGARVAALATSPRASTTHT
ncbi:glutamate-cysteine ligase family protein, partial [Arthrobacter sp. 2YAF22_2]|uniref:glutamate-cysteine ligase family protein n=1 Tax=Arthrobacter sp. 2YAF22_2 TaxID=3233029 RepID=UPI003F92E344